jgi:hypothetical protein
MNPEAPSLDKTTAISCDKCNNTSFIEGFILRKVSRFLTGTPKDGLIPITVFVCTSCSHVNEEFIPSELKNKSEG